MKAKYESQALILELLVLYVGADSDSALSYKRLKLEDARNAAWQSLHGGIVAGGGVALFNAAKVIASHHWRKYTWLGLVYQWHRLYLNWGQLCKGILRFKSY